MIPGFQQDASWFKARWRAEMRPFGRKWLRGERRLKEYCVAAFNEQSGKAIFRRTLTLPNWAHYVMTVVRGMAVQSAGGASPDQLRGVAQVALGAWPKR